MRIGFGYDVHSLVNGRKLILGGVEIPHTTGLLGHSDADVLIHAVMDALLGAAAVGDIGKHFPDNYEELKNIESRKLLRSTAKIIANAGYSVGNIDCTICAEAPKLAPYIAQMRQNIADDLKIDVNCVSVKATTTEGLGLIGRGEGISAYAVCLLNNT
ncbi:MAG: 2-C-methyl-D-erythritol 2,4-cyclodiphosphate synthase [Oscillospiraceae bacterium]|nr:2-C-methyl-D-erythritol 2,4-cyclodiphosphate synthase [Oscillospiraceae bacterium]